MNHGRSSDDLHAPTRAQRGWWLEDATPGAMIRHPGGRTVSADEHARLAWLTGNASDVHGDAHRAAAGVFGEPVVLGALSAAIAVGLGSPATCPPTGAARALPRGWRRIALRAIVRAGDTLHASSTFQAVRPDPGGEGGLVERTIEARNQHGEVVVLIEEEIWAPSRDDWESPRRTPSRSTPEYLDQA